MVEEMIVEQADGPDGGRGRLHPLRDAAEPRRPWSDARRPCAGCRTCPSCFPSPSSGNGETASGESVERMLAPLPAGCPQPIAWGMNCGIGPDGLLGAVEQAVRLTTLPLVVQPNAGMPKEVENRRIYLCSPEYLASYAKRYVGLGVVGRGRLLRHHARAHPRGGLGRQAAGAGEGHAARRRRRRGVEPKDARPAGRKIAARRPAGQPPVDHHRRTAAAARLRSAIDGGEGQGLARARRRRDQHPRRPAGQRRLSSLVAAERILREAGDRADPALLLPRSEPDRHAGRPAGLRGLRRAEHSVRHRRSAQAGRLSARHRRVRRRFDRHGGRAAAVELRHRPGRPGHRPAHLRRDRRGARSDRARPAAANWTASARRSRPAPSSPSRSRSSIPTPCCGFSTRSSATAFRSSPASGRW